MLPFVGMTLKKLFVLGSMIGGAAYLSDRSRRQRFFRSSSDWLDRLATRAEEALASASAAASAASTPTTERTGYASTPGNYSGY